MTNKDKTYYGGILPEVEVTPYILKLTTQYPFINEFTPFTGHSELKAVERQKTEDGRLALPTLACINKKMLDADYNLLTNNCSDATREVLEEISGKKLNPFLFTTPGDVRDFFKENFKVFNDYSRKGEDNYYTYISEADADIVKKYAQKQRDINIEAGRQKLREKRIKEGKATSSDLQYSNGGHLFDGRSENTQQLNDATYVVPIRVPNLGETKKITGGFPLGTPGQWLGQALEGTPEYVPFSQQLQELGQYLQTDLPTEEEQKQIQQKQREETLQRSKETPYEGVLTAGLQGLSDGINIGILNEAFAPTKVVKSINTPIINNTYQTKLDWTPDNWFYKLSQGARNPRHNPYTIEDSERLASHLEEYMEIEKKAFQSGAFILDNKGNVIVKDTPEMSPQEWIIRHSKAMKPWNNERISTGVSKDYRSNFTENPSNTVTWGTTTSPTDVLEYATSRGGGTIPWTKDVVDDMLRIKKENIENLQQAITEAKNNGQNYIVRSNIKQDLGVAEQRLERLKKYLERLEAKGDDLILDGGQVYQVITPKNAKQSPIIDAQEYNWDRFPYKDSPSGYTSTDHIVNSNRLEGYDISNIINVRDTKKELNLGPLNEKIINNGVPRKSVLGNNGDLDINKPGLFTGVALPLGLAALISTLSLNNKKSDGGKLNKYSKGTEHDLSNEEILDLIKKGYKISYL